MRHAPTVGSLSRTLHTQGGTAPEADEGANDIRASRRGRGRVMHNLARRVATLGARGPDPGGGQDTMV